MMSRGSLSRGEVVDANMIGERPGSLSKYGTCVCKMS